MNHGLFSPGVLLLLLIALSGGAVCSADDMSVNTTPDTWTLTLISGDTTKPITLDTWEDMVSQNNKEKTTSDNRVFSGLPIYKIFESQGFTPTGGTVRITGQDGYSVDIPWDDISGNTDYLLADRMNNEIIPEFITFGAESVNIPAWPLMVIDPEFPSVNSVGSVANLTLLS